MLSQANLQSFYEQEVHAVITHLAHTDSDQSLSRMTEYARGRATIDGCGAQFELGDGGQPTPAEARAVFHRLAQGHPWNEDIAEAEPGGNQPVATDPATGAVIKYE